MSGIEDAELSACERAARCDQERLSSAHAAHSSKHLFEHQNAPRRAHSRSSREFYRTGSITGTRNNTAVMRLGSMGHTCGRQNANHSNVIRRLLRGFRSMGVEPPGERQGGAGWLRASQAIEFDEWACQMHHHSSPSRHCRLGLLRRNPATVIQSHYCD